MNVAKWLLLALLALPFMELAVFIIVAEEIGFLSAMMLIIVSTMAGAMVLRHAGGSHIARMRVAVGTNNFTSLQADGPGTLTLLAGILLLIPGFITDVLGFCCCWRRCAGLWPRCLACGPSPPRAMAWSILDASNGIRCPTPHCPTGAIGSPIADSCSLKDAVLANRRAQQFGAARSAHVHDQWRPSAGRRPAAAAQRGGAIHQGLLVRKSERAAVAGVRRGAAADRHSDQRCRQADVGHRHRGRA